MSVSGYIPGDFWRICERCGAKTRSSKTYRTWDGLYVCHDDFETRHPQDFVRGRKDLQNVPNPRPEPAHIFVGTGAPIMTETEIPLLDQTGMYLTIEVS